MQTNNIVSTPNITGDVSSCKTEIATIDCATRSNFLVCNNVSYATNNCTNEQQVYNSWSVSGDGATIIMFGIPIALFMVVVCLGGAIAVLVDWFDKLKYNRDSKRS